MYTAYLFDFDLTLVDSSDAIAMCFNKTLASLGRDTVPPDTVKRTIGLPMRVAVGKIIGTDNAAVIESFIQSYQPFADRYMTDNTIFFPRTVATLTELKNRGAGIAIISSKTANRIAEKFERERLAHLIDMIIGSKDVEKLKPAPDGINMAIKKLGLNREQTIYCGDSIIDAEAAQNAGLDFAAVTTGTTTADELKKYPHKIIMRDIEEILKL